MASVPCCPLPPDTRTSLERLQDRLFQIHPSRPTRRPLRHLCRLYHRGRPPGLLARQALLDPTHQAQARLQARRRPPSLLACQAFLGPTHQAQARAQARLQAQARSSSRSRPFLRRRGPPLPASIHQALRLRQSTRVAVRLHLASVRELHHRRRTLAEHRRHQCTLVEALLPRRSFRVRHLHQCTQAEAHLFQPLPLDPRLHQSTLEVHHRRQAPHQALRCHRATQEDSRLLQSTLEAHRRLQAPHRARRCHRATQEALTQPPRAQRLPPQPLSLSARRTTEGTTPTLLPPATRWTATPRGSELDCHPPPSVKWSLCQVLRVWTFATWKKTALVLRSCPLEPVSTSRLSPDRTTLPARLLSKRSSALVEQAPLRLRATSLL